MAIAPEEQPRLLELSVSWTPTSATHLPAVRGTAGKTTEEIREGLVAAIGQFGRNVKEKFSRDGEW